MRVYVAGAYLQESGPRSGMLVDYADISAAVKPLVEQYLDHHYLNETLPLANPTSECIARWVYERLSGMGYLQGVEIEETCTSRCYYGKGA